MRAQLEPPIGAESRWLVVISYEAVAIVDFEADGDAIELRDVACLLIAHQVHEWDEASDGYKAL